MREAPLATDVWNLAWCSAPAVVPAAGGTKERRPNLGGFSSTRLKIARDRFASFGRTVSALEPKPIEIVRRGEGVDFLGAESRTAGRGLPIPTLVPEI